MARKLKIIKPSQTMEEIKNKRKKKNASANVSFSASLPGDVRGFFAESLCAVKYSTNPYKDIKESIVEMIRNVGVQDWNDMEELIYCYVVLNSSEVHKHIEDAFLSLCTPDPEKHYPVAQNGEEILVFL